MTVVIPTYNAAAFIARTLESVKRQTLPPDEVIVVDDCSKDDTVQAAGECLQDAPFAWRVLTLERNSGGPATPLNTGIAAAKEGWIVTLDHDDELVDDRIERVNTMPEGLCIGRLIVREESRDRGHLLDTAWGKVSDMVFTTLPSREGLGEGPAAATDTRQFVASSGPSPNPSLQKRGVKTIPAATAYAGLARHGCYAMSCTAMAFPKSLWKRHPFDNTIVTCIDFAFLEAALRDTDLHIIDAPVAYWTWRAENLSHDAPRRVFEVSTVMERIHRHCPDLDLRKAMLDRCYYLTVRGHQAQAKELLRMQRWGWDRLATSLKCRLRSWVR